MLTVLISDDRELKYGACDVSVRICIPFGFHLPRTCYRYSLKVSEDKQNWYKTGTELVQSWYRTGRDLVQDWYRTGTALKSMINSVICVTGEIWLTKPVDRERTGNWMNLTVEVKDGENNPLTSAIDIVVHVKDVNDEKPQ